ncbi:Circadian clock protein kinase KaiC [uncultured archaeon]|nr:Circadian clock protein kinase KaiC [uncultured archaeon]
MTLERIKTGIFELDKILGGFPAGKTVLVTGDPGTGKTIFGLQFAHSCCVLGLKTRYVSTEENAADLRLQGSSFGWEIESLEKRGLLAFTELAGNRAMEIETALSIKMDAVKGNFSELTEHLPEGTRVLVIDSLGTHAGNLTPFEFRDRFDLLVHSLANMGITAMVIFDSVTSKEFNDIALFSTYGAIQLMKRENPYTDRRERVMDIVKMRNTKTPIQLLTYEIGPGGIVLSSPGDLSATP